MKGLTDAEAAARLRRDGPNAVKDKKTPLPLRVLKWLFSPINLMLMAAIALSFYTGRFFDAYFILGLVVLNTGINTYHHRRAENAIASLQAKLAVMVRVYRSDKLIQINAEKLVQDDLIRLVIGDIVPADAEMTSGQNVSVNEAAVTGESLPQFKNQGDKLLSGSYVTTGSCEALVTATGARSAYGKALVLVEQADKRSLLEEEMLRIAYLLFAASLASAVILTLVLLTAKQPWTEILRIDLSLLIAGIPVSLPTVMTIIIGLGVSGLAKKHIIVRRLGALENLANTNLLLTDKTGTLTQNRISVSQVVPLNGKEYDVIRAAYVAIDDSEGNPIDSAIEAEARRLEIKRDWKLKSHVPADSQRKRNTAIYAYGLADHTVSSGAPQVVADLCKLSDGARKRMDEEVAAMAAKGFRVLAVADAYGDEEKGMRLLGLIGLADPPRPDAAQTIAALSGEGIETRMITGDNVAISRHLAGEIGINGQMYTAEQLHKNRIPDLKHWWRHAGGFAEIMPEDKYKLTELGKRGNVVAVTGDGINDLPSLDTADVGIAVKNAVSALKQSADLVILSDGIEVLKTAITEARKIFERLYSYSVYRISESFRLIITIAILGILVGGYPLTPIQIILLAFLNDFPIISLAYNRVVTTHRPANSRSGHKLLRGLLHGSVGVFNSMLFYLFLAFVIHLPLAQVQTAFFLKLTVSGHLLIYVAHTDRRWYKFLPSSQVILATTITQLLATLAAGIGILMTPIPIWLIGFIWLWAFLFMQVSDIVKVLVPKK
jgi:H+-transporting ATPase